MEVIRRNADYALRIVTILARRAATEDRMTSSRVLSQEALVSYTLTCKLLQKLQKKGIVRSVMGPKGGFELARPSEKTTFLEVIEAVQGPIRMNRCLLGDNVCPLKERCPLHGKLSGLQKDIYKHLRSATFGDALLETQEKGKRRLL
jgi:Rrf2 family iron-sulfur cluster assembly transcriptional regulator